VAVARNSQQALLLQQQQLQGQAAEQERSGRPVPQATLDQIKQIRAERTRLDTRIQNYEQARKQAHEDFAALKTRLEPLLEP
jgi:negative regulator of sigma E activity